MVVVSQRVLKTSPPSCLQWRQRGFFIGVGEGFLVNTRNNNNKLSEWILKKKKKREKKRYAPDRTNSKIHTISTNTTESFTWFKFHNIQ